MLENDDVIFKVSCDLYHFKLLERSGSFPRFEALGIFTSGEILKKKG